MMILGIDPGGSGGFCLMNDDEQIIQCVKSPKTNHDIKTAIRDLVSIADLDGHQVKCVIEDVWSSPQMGVCSAFTFGRGLGLLEGILTTLGVSVAQVTPQKWQKMLGCMTKGDKNVSKAKAQQLFPQHKFTHATADATLIAKYGVMATKQGLI